MEYIGWNQGKDGTGTRKGRERDRKNTACYRLKYWVYAIVTETFINLTYTDVTVNYLAQFLGYEEAFNLGGNDTRCVVEI